MKIPAALRTFGKGFGAGAQAFGKNISTIINSVLLAAGYIIGVGISALPARIIGKHFLDRKPKGKTYWRAVQERSRGNGDEYRQF